MLDRPQCVSMHLAMLQTCPHSCCHSSARLARARHWQACQTQQLANPGLSIVSLAPSKQELHLASCSSMPLDTPWEWAATVASSTLCTTSPDNGSTTAAMAAVWGDMASAGSAPARALVMPGASVARPGTGCPAVTASHKASMQAAVSALAPRPRQAPHAAAACLQGFRHFPSAWT